MTNHFDKPRLLRASPHSADYAAIRRSFDDEGVPRGLHDAGAGADAAAAEESGYTSSPSSALSGEPEAISLAEQERQTRQAREKRERVVISPLILIDKQLEKLEGTGHYKSADVRFVRKKLGAIGQDALRSGG